MKINGFYSHTIRERLQMIRRAGEFISRIKYYGFYIELYILDDKFVEAYYNAHTGTLAEVELLSPTDERLNLFAVPVDLSDLFT